MHTTSAMQQYQMMTLAKLENIKNYLQLFIPELFTVECAVECVWCNTVAGLHLEIDPRGGEMSIYEKEGGRSPVYMRG